MLDHEYGLMHEVSLPPFEEINPPLVFDQVKLPFGTLKSNRYLDLS